jgi:hypothetical protein
MALPFLPLDFYRHYWQYAAGRFLEFRVPVLAAPGSVVLGAPH